jgi:hypothetical protein
MQEIVPPKLNKNNGLFSLLLNRKNLIFVIGFIMSLFLWSGFKNLSSDQKIAIEVVIAFTLVPLMIDVYGRPMHRFLIDSLRHFIGSKKQRTVLAKDISEGILISPDSIYSKVYKVEPINLSMSGEEEVYAFKRYLQDALFGLKNTIQIITVQEHSTIDENLDVEIKRVRNLKGILKQRANEYLDEYMKLTDTMERKFYIILTTPARNIEDAKRKLADQEVFLRLLEQTKIKLAELKTAEILDLSNQILNKINE